MSNIILPDDPNWKDPLIMKNAYEESATPKMAQVKRGAEFDKQRKIAMDKWGTEGSYPPVPYPNSAIAQAPDAWTKTAQMTGVSNLMTNPMWFSPLHTPQNWQIASKRREIYQWARFFYENEPKVGGAIDFYCFAPETQVLMADGSQKSISSIQPGDMVRSHDGSANQVNKVFVRQTKEDMLRIGISGISLGKALQVTKGHKMLTKRDGKIDYVQAQELKQGDYLLTPIDYSDAINDKSVDVDFSWLLGLYAAEGCGIPYDHVDQNRQRNSYYKGIYITIGYHENELAKKITDIIHRLYGNNKVQINKDEESGIIRISAYGRSIADDLIGLCPGMSKDGSKRFAPIVMKFGQENLMYLLAGFLDGDGCFNKNNGFQGVGVSKKLSEQIANMCDRLGLEYSFTATRISNSNRQVCYNVRLSRRACKPLIDLTQKILDNCVDESKIRNTPYFKEGNYIYRKIRSIRTVSYEGIVYDLEVDNVHSYVVNRIAVSNSRFPMNGFKLECSSRKVLKYFEHQVVKRLKLNEQFKMISSEYFMLGDVFIHMEVDCPICHSSAVNPDTGEMCNHPGGSFRRMIVINPDWIEVQQSILADEPSIVMVPDEELKRIVFYKQPKNIYDRIPDRIKELVLSNRPIPLSNRVVSHIRHMPVPYGTYGTSLIRRLFTTLAYKTKIMTANWIVAERLILPVRVVKIGSDNRPATSADIADIQQQLGATANDPNLTIVTHHNFEYEWYGAAGKILQVTQEMEHVGKEILDGFMLNQSLLNGEMSGYQSAQVGVETLIRRIESWRHTLADWCEENIFKPVAEMQGFIDEELSDEVGEACFLYPKIKWNDLNLKDQTQWHQTLMQLHDKAVISTQTLMEELDLNYDQEIKRMRYEQTQVGPMGGGLGQGAAGGGMGLGDMGGGAGGMGAGMEPMAPGGDMGMGAPGGDMDMGGAGGAPPPAMAAGGKVLKKGKGKEQQQELENVQMPMIKLTSIEQEMAQMLEGLGTKLGWSPQQIQERIRLQFPVENPTGGRQYALDFAFPHFKIGIESDGEIWHNQPEQIEEDKERDQLLAQRGWTILRFDDKTIGEAPQAVLSTIETYVKKAMKGSTKKASTSNGIICLFAIRKGKVTNLEGNYDEYSKQLYISESIEPEDKLSKVNYKNPPK